MVRYGRWLLLLLVVTLATPPTLAAARPAEEPCPRGAGTFSVLFLIDQSDSMAGTKISGRPIPASDPSAERQYAPTFAVSRLGEERFIVPSHPANALAVVSFGRQPSVDLPWTAIAPDPRDLSGWDAQRADLVSHLSASSRGDTDYRAAFATAARQFAEQGRACGGNSGPRAIVLITDGAPCVVAAGCDPTAPYWSSDQSYMRQLTADVEAAFDRSTLRLWVLTRAPASSVGLERTLPAWQALASWYGGAVVPLTGSHVDTANKVNQILEQLGLRSRWSLCSAPATVAPSVSQLSAWSVKLAGGTSPTIVLPDGSTLRANDPRVTLHADTATDEEIFVTSPPAGQWQFTHCADFATYADTAAATATPTPTTVPTLTATPTVATATPAPSATAVAPTATTPPTPTGTPVPATSVPLSPTLLPITPTPTPAPGPPGPVLPAWLVGILGFLAFASMLGGLAFYLYNRQGPRGRLVFVGVANRDERGVLELAGWPHAMRLGAVECARYLPAVGLASLTVQAGPVVDGRTTVKLTLIGLDGHVVNHHFRDNEADFVTDGHDAEVVYEAITVTSRVGRRVTQT